MSNMNQMLRQAQALQRKMAKAQEELGQRQVTGSAGGGMVKATATGSGELLGVEISPEVVDPDDVEMLQDLIVAAVNQAMKTAAEAAGDQLGGLTGGLDLGGLFG